MGFSKQEVLEWGAIAFSDIDQYSSHKQKLFEPAVVFEKFTLYGLLSSKCLGTAAMY